MRSKGVIVILIGIGLLLLSYVFASERVKCRTCGLREKISKMEVVFIEGKHPNKVPEDLGLSRYDSYHYKKNHYVGRVAIPLKFTIALSIVMILSGSGMAILAPKKEKVSS
ncbi:hypothetical protein [Desulfogranum marinum]|uniref:hypothetical protein n=1 Tax=Desulfogranum marinum TaxID=453220 RepID=UPI0029C62CD9|nr:hypothetical protein [Desulfogranum marinum]